MLKRMALNNNNLMAALNNYLFFFYFSGITHFLLQVTDTTIFVGLRQAIYISLLWLIPLILFPKKTKLISGLIGVILWVSSLLSLGYFCIYGQEFSQSVLFIMFESNTAESSEYVAQYFKWWMILVFVAHSFVAYMLWRRVRPIELSQKHALIFSGIIFALSIAMPTFKDYVIKGKSWEDTVDKLQIRLEPAEPWQLVVGYLQYREQLNNMQSLLAQNSKLPPIKNLKDKYAGLPATLVLVLGESTNREHMSLYGYSRPTTPKLDKIKDQLSIFNNVISARPYTIEALEQVLTFADQEHADLVLKKPSLMNMMQQAGYKTYWITNQQTITKRNTMLTTFSKQMDVQHYMNNSRAQNSREYDENVFEPFQNALNDEAPRKFIIIHLLGTHMKYNYRYPPEYEVFNDRSGLADVFDNHQAEVINTYDNAVLYNDHVVSSLIDQLAKKNNRSLMVYLSDHGEDVYDTPPHQMLGRNEGKPTLAMYAVPFMMWQSPEWKNGTNMDFNSMTNRPYSTSHFIHTWADLAGLSFDEFDATKSLINPAFTERPLWVGSSNNKKFFHQP
jgi:heptose-I-phosphate ethanolaminephosphotransferase